MSSPNLAIAKQLDPNPTPFHLNPWRNSMRSFVAAAIVIVAWTSTASSAQLSSMFQSSNHDFGTVARAAKTEHRFYFENPFSQPMHVRSVRTSCGCTTPIVETEVVPVGGRGSILAKFNTGTHTGARAATLTVTIDKPTFGEVQLHVKGYIRSDVVFQPGEATFGNIMQGESKSIDVAVDYAGKPTWQINKVTSSDSYVSVSPSEVSRQNGRVRYNLNIAVSSDAPAGPLESEVIVHTNDRNLTTVPLRLVANITPEISVSPKTLSFGDVIQNEPIKQLIVLKGQKPFAIKSIESDLFSIETAPNEESKTLHALPLVVRPREGDFGKEIQGKIIFTTDLPEKPTIEVGVDFRLKAIAEK
ncbi:MAG: DUF1573 domain-containing protein [Pirellula sp.]